MIFKIKYQRFKYVLSLLISFAIANFCLCQNDASLTYIDLIAKNNQVVEESRNQHMINWGEVPFNIEGVLSIKETYFRSHIDTSVTVDTTIIIDSKHEHAIKTYTQVYEFRKISKDTQQIIIDTSFIVTYVKGRIISQEEYGNVMLFNYYPSGLLKELVLGDNNLLSSEQIEDTIHYSLNLIDPITKKPIESEYMPTIRIKCIKTDGDHCFHYKNVFMLKKMLDSPVINKEIIQCRNGDITKEVILDRYKNYAQKEKDFDFVYDVSTLKKKICKPDVQYSEYKNVDYEYDSKGNLKKIIGYTLTTEYEYDDRNNVISEINYFTQSKGLQKFWIREIEYVE